MFCEHVPRHSDARSCARHCLAQLGCVFLEVPFKRVNDTHGHDVGDRVLQELARLMGESSRENDVLCRVGGEEFLMLLPNASVEVAAQVAERFRALVERTPIEPVGRITVSLGVAHWPQDGSGIDKVLKRADEMLYRAKQHGRNRVETADARQPAGAVPA